MTVKRINYSGRKKLTREEANILIHPPIGENDVATFDATLELRKLLPEAADSRVFVEAYHRTTRIRFDFGTVSAIVEPPLGERRLDEFQDWRDVRFRVRVSDVQHSAGRILAVGDRIKPQGLDESEETDLVRFCDAHLDGRLWDIEFDENGPIVQVERNSGGAQEVGRCDQFRAAAYPEILRRTLQRALIEEQASHDDEEHWFNTWYEGFLKAKLNMPIPPTDSIAAQIDWIDQAVNNFSRNFRLADFWKPTLDLPGEVNA
ncbi:MAG: hypothetical protein R3C56_39965 [Pirellulaceae bacterium]